MVIRSPRVLLPEGLRPAEVTVEHGTISSVRLYNPDHPSPDHPSPDHPSPDHPTAVLFPGLVDTHVHVNEPGRTEWEGFATASAAAAAGGITTLVDMPLNSVPPTTTVAGLEAKRAAARSASVNVEFWGGVVPENTPELDVLADAGVRGFKCFLVPTGVPEFSFVSQHHLRAALPIIARRDLPLLVHAEDSIGLCAVGEQDDPSDYFIYLRSRTPRAEVEAIATLVRLCREFGARIHVVHVAAAEAIDLLAAARAEGLPITAETCPHYLTFCAEDIPDNATEFKCAPPIRERWHREALWRALDAGILDLIATDHSPCPPEMKRGKDFFEAWGGVSSLELSLAAVWTGASVRGLGLERLGEWMCAAPARLAGLADRGTIEAGKRADFVLWDPDEAFVVDASQLRQRHKLTPYQGMTLRGRVLQTWIAGEVVYRKTGFEPSAAT